MILLHLAMNGKACMLDKEAVIFVEDIANDGKEFTRIYLKHGIPGETETLWIDVKESVEKISKAIK